MLTLEQIKNAVIANEVGYDRDNCAFLDGRDWSRLVRFYPVSDWLSFKCALKEGAETPEIIPYTRETVLDLLKSDLEFAFEKALNKRGISSALMYEVIKMWMWVLEDDLMGVEYYAQYGLPLYKAVALKYGFPNEIGEDSGSEYKYSSEGE